MSETNKSGFEFVKVEEAWEIEERERREEVVREYTEIKESDPERFFYMVEELREDAENGGHTLGKVCDYILSCIFSAGLIDHM